MMCAIHNSNLETRNPKLRAGLTLVEMLVSLVCVLMLMLAYTQLFSDVGNKVGGARSMIELSSRMRSAAQRLRSDLEARTCDMTPWQHPESGAGYFEIIEGPLCDATPAAVPSPARNNGLTAAAYAAAYPATGGLFNDATNSIEKYPLGDTDDVLMFTIRSKDGALIGKSASINGGDPVQSDSAEVIWFLRPTMQADNVTPVDPPTYTLYRRQLLVVPTWAAGPVTFGATDVTDGLEDISAHLNLATGNFDANSLSDLAKRENRFAHKLINNTSLANGFPHTVDPAMLVPFGGKFSAGAYSIDPNAASYARYGEDVVLTNVLSFDVQVWDPNVPVKTNGGIAVLPGDPGYAGGAASGATGGYVDLAYSSPTARGATVSLGDTGASNTTATGLKLVAVSSSPTFLKDWMFDKGKDGNGLPNYSAHGQTPATFDTWSFSYEMDGMNQVSGSTTVPDPNADAGTNQIYGITSGSSAYETSPPYPVPLRGLRVRIRCYEPDARDVREVTVTESFVPE